MAWDPSRSGIGEARLTVLKALIQSKISTLNTALDRDSITSSFLDSPFPSALVGADCVVLGDADTLWPETKGSIRICITSGGPKTGLDFTADITHLRDPNTLGLEIKVLTSIYVYIHPKAIRVADPSVMMERYEIARERISDWLRGGVFNSRYADPSTGNYSPVRLILESKEVDGTNFDAMDRCLVTSGNKGFFAKSFGGQEIVYGIYMAHVGQVIA